MMKILIVDDDPLLLLITTITLEKSGFEVTKAGGPLQAIATVEKHVFDAILIDYLMPEMDGPELLIKLREIPGVQTIPILVLTGRPSQEVLNEVVALGARGVITKPYNPAELPRLVRQLINPASKD